MRITDAGLVDASVYGLENRLLTARLCSPFAEGSTICPPKARNLVSKILPLVATFAAESSGSAGVENLILAKRFSFAIDVFVCYWDTCDYFCCDFSKKSRHNKGLIVFTSLRKRVLIGNNRISQK